MTVAPRTVTIDFLPESVERYREGYAIVAIDVIRATTTLATAVAQGRQCYVARSVAHAMALAAELKGSLLAGEVGGVMPAGFEITNSPAAVALRSDDERPMILVSSSGTPLLYNARHCDAVYVACFRNYAAVADHVGARHARVAVIGAGTRGEFREEDQMCCAWIAERLMASGHAARDAKTQELVARWKGASPQACRVSKSVAYLTRTNQLHDLEFILSHINDMDQPLALDGNEIVRARLAKRLPLPKAHLATSNQYSEA
jgi:2-phosphosulfolactate phosphatase